MTTAPHRLMNQPGWAIASAWASVEVLMNRLFVAHGALTLLVAAGCTSGAGDEANDDTTPSFCSELGLAEQPFLTADTGTGLADIAGDFTVPIGNSDWVFSQRFTGCSSYVFFVHFPGRSDDWTRNDLDSLVVDAPDNVEFFFMSDDDDRQGRNDFLDALAERLDRSLAANLRKKGKEAWLERAHFVNKRAKNLEGSIGEYINGMVALNSDPSAVADLGDRGQVPVPLPQVFGIDRDQRFDGGGNLSPFVGAPEDEISMAVWLPHFYNYRHDLDTRFAEEAGVTVVSVMDELTTGRTFTLPAALPDAATMASFDRLEFDVTIDCLYDNPFACSEWDRIAAIYWCEDGEACEVRREVARWITPYWRRGRQRYALEASPMLGLLREGGTQHFHVSLGPSWERGTEWRAAVSLRMSDTGGPRAVAAIPAFGGGNFDAAYNEREPLLFTPPAGTTRTELVTMISGHGQDGGNNCAEWCDHRHTFSVNNTDLETIAHEGGISEPTGCAMRADSGVIPGQWGNWSQSRAYWCPGMAVPLYQLDLTDQVTVGSESTLGYLGSFGSGDPSGGNISMSSYVVFYEDP